MEETTLSLATILWLLIPQALIIILSLLGFMVQRKKSAS